MKKEEIIQNTLKHTEEIKKAFDEGREPGKKECEVVLDDLDIIKEYLKTSRGGEVIMGNIDELFQDFSEYAEGSKQCLQNMLAMISDGRVPSTQSVSELDSTIETLRAKYASVYEAALEQLPAEEMPSEDAAASEFVEAVKNSKTLNAKKQIEEAAECLKKFLTVRSLVARYAEALSPIQAKASELLNAISAGTEMEVEKLEQETEGPKTVLAAIECEDKDSDEGMALCDKVAELYPGYLSTGIVANKYFFDPDACPVVEEPKGESAPEEKADPQPAEDPAPAEEPTETPEEEQKEPEIVDAPIPEEENPEESSFVKTLRETGCFIEDDTEIGVVQSEISPNESRKISASVFWNEIKSANVPAQKVIVKALDCRSSFTMDVLTETRGVPETIAESTVSFMLKRGLLRQYSLENGERLYCTSPRLEKALTFADAAKKVDMRQKAIEDWGSRVDPKASSLASRITLSELYRDAVARLTERNVSKYTETNRILTEAFCCKVYDSMEKSDSEMFAGAFWEDTDECDKFIDEIRKTEAEGEGFSLFILAAFDLARGEKIMRALMQEIGDILNPVPLYLYSYKEKKYYIYPSLESIESNDVLAIDYNVTPEELEDFEEETLPEGEEDKEPSEMDENETETVTDPTTVAPMPTQKQTQEPSQPIAPVIPSVRTKPAQSHVINMEDIKKNLYSILGKKDFYAATAYIKSLSHLDDGLAKLYFQLAYALNDPMGHQIYSSVNAFNLIGGQSGFENYLVIATALRMFFSNQVRYDYNIKGFYTGIKDYELLGKYPSLSKALYAVEEFKDSQKKGMDAYADYHAKSRTELEKDLQALRKEAESFYDSFVIGHKKERCSLKRFVETKTLMFSVNSEIGQNLKAILDGDYELQPLTVEFLQTNFYGEDAIIGEDTFDSDLLWAYIIHFWDEAGSHMMYKRHEDIKGSLRTNINNQTVKAVQLMARWCNLVEKLENRADDAGAIEYKRVKMPLVKNIEEASAAIRTDFRKAANNPEEKAGLAVLEYALNDLARFLDGTFDESSRKYFYMPFLLTDHVILGSDLMPDLEMHSASLPALQPDQRILKHLECVKEKTEDDYLERLHVILDEKGDDYGSAQQIKEYIYAIDSAADLSELAAQIETGESFAKQDADIAKADFVGEIELAQSYGQIDNAVEDKKEMILQIVDEWNDWALDTANYGFFKRVMTAYLEDIKESSKDREADLLKQLEKCQSDTSTGLSVEEKNARIARIQEMINEQNYTVAEDLLSRFSRIEDENEERIEEDFLRDFLSNYDDYYVPVAKHTANFATLVSRTRNKEGRGAKRLAENWLPGGSAIGKDRLTNLLSGLGFKVAKVQQQQPIGRFENYNVTTLSDENGKRVHISHPIAAFGSSASQDGFRVVCINGNYTADGLIDIMKQIGDAKHTLLLVDAALSKSERRRLARKSKNALGEKLFGVLDRTVMMYLVRNYDENKINRMLMSLITPFGYYQPYVWESANVMPPEIFMGRKNELERIKSATGVNIVYGGRQLGKSALLKKAKDDIDRDENNDRAVYIEIKGKDYKEACRKIGHELYDQFILDKDIDTTDWDELARVVRRRLQSDTMEKIPYLLLLLDEADTFIESCEAVNYKPFDALKEIQSIGIGRFKFVIAGLRNVVRFKREAALGNNSVLTHLQSMTVKPFNTSEARELLEIPLHYLGLRFPKEKESLITLILATTNYFPGLIQLYCAKLIEAMRSKDYAGYDESDTPIYEVSEGHIKKVLADPTFTQQIREKYEITLKLDEDNYYYLIALLMAYLYHNNGYSAGYTAEDVRKAGEDLSIAKISGMDETRLGAFMEELKELNVLRSTDDTHYLFTRVTFFQMMGTSSEVEDKLEDYMEA